MHNMHILYFNESLQQECCWFILEPFKWGNFLKTYRGPNLVLYAGGSTRYVPFNRNVSCKSKSNHSAYSKHL